MEKIVARVNVIEQGVLKGWFDDKKAQHWAGDTSFDGRNHIDVNTGCQWSTQTLWRSSGGRWVLEEESRWGSCKTEYLFLDDEDAREWLLRNNKDKTFAKFFGSIEEESGPSDSSVTFRCSTEMKDFIAQHGGGKFLRALVAKNMEVSNV